VYFDKFGNHYLHAHKHKDTGKLYHRIKDQNVTTIKEVNGKSVQKKEHIYEVNPDHELIRQLSAVEVLATPIADAPQFADKEASLIYEKQAQDSAKLRAELEELKKNQSNIEELKAEVERLKQEKEVMEQMVSESQKDSNQANTSKKSK
jgi:hypothetical protein